MTFPRLACADLTQGELTLCSCWKLDAGKTTLMERLASHAHTRTHTQPYTLNLDPAVTHVPYSPNVDIRDTVDYAEVMKQYNLGPNGGILTSLNLFTTKFDQVLELVEKRAPTVE